MLLGIIEGVKKTSLTAWLLAGLFAVLAAAISGTLATLLLHSVTSFSRYISSLAPWALPVMLTSVGVLAGFIWWWIRLKKSGSIAGGVQKGEEVFLLGRSALDAGLQVTAVGFGTSMGREAAPRLLAAAMTWAACHRLPRETKVIITAASAGGALGVVYDAPLAGAIYTLTIVLKRFSWQALLVSLVASCGGVFLSKLAIGDHSNYTLGEVTVNSATILWVGVTIVIAPLIGLAFKYLQKRFVSGKVPLKILPLTVGLAFGVTGVVALVRPEVMGNGVVIVQDVLANNVSLQVLLILLVVKASMTVLTLSSGAVGGVLMPAFALGALAGGVGTVLIPHANTAAFAIIGGAAVLSVTEKSWMFGVCFALELVDAPPVLWMPVLCAGAGAYYLAPQYQKLFTRTC